MSGFWDAAERVRSGATAQAAPRPVSRFEGEMETVETDIERIEPLADDAPAPVQRPGQETVAPPEPLGASTPKTSSERLTVRETIEVRTEATAQPDRSSALEAPPSAEAGSALIAPLSRPPIQVEPSTPLVMATAPAASVAATPRAPVSPPAAVEASPAPTQPARETTVERTTVIVTAAPLAPPPEPAAPAPLGLEVMAQSPAAERQPLAIHIDRIEIRIDPPAPPTPTASARRPAPPVALNDYLARRGQ